MCGIAGIVSADAARLQPNVAAMQRAIAHRGPDESGCEVFSHAALGHQRLSIVDLKSGQQPMRSHDGRLSIIFNGEIFGYTGIRDSLSGYPFRTTSDTEVILALYEKYGEGMMTRLPGMFVFAIWDEREQTLFCARDRFGEKPLYFAYGPNQEFIFASELKGLLASRLVKPEIDSEVLSACVQRLYVPPDKTIYRNVFTLPPAHCLTVQHGKPTVQRYWRLPLGLDRVSIGEAEEKFETLLRQAVRKQLVADVPVGAFLSGGLDSGSIVALAAPMLGRNLQTFSFGFGDERNELADAKKIANRYQTRHHELVEDDYQIGDLLEKMQTVYDEPFADSSNIPTFLISRFAAQHMKVVLTGDGGDELLGGYTHWYLKLAQQKASFEKALWMKLIVDKILPGFLATSGISARRQHIRDYQQRTFVVKRHRAQNRYFNGHQLEQLGLPQPYEMPFEGAPANSIDDAFRVDLQDYLPGDILVKADRASMANSLELRCPYLDVDLAEFCIALPWNLKMDDTKGKLLLRNIAKQWLPESHFALPKKGFGAPVDKWLQRKDMQKLKGDFLANRQSKIFDHLDFDGVKIYQNLDNYQTWTILNLALWFDQHK